MSDSFVIVDGISDKEGNLNANFERLLVMSEEDDEPYDNDEDTVIYEAANSSEDDQEEEENNDDDDNDGSSGTWSDNVVVHDFWFFNGNSGMAPQISLECRDPSD
ncbi:hypothetical protein ANCDUO_13679 [Ancylostoma duodenale]|uniref:Uncharacterized protein n=1 Tax=Ancylostoma duodenale TaxID=51022 RepID=A0A0C2GB60_9BILA|nr:hypothetical protein ANCDUO_13679 [Ancylostoma duodenale]